MRAANSKSSTPKRRQAQQEERGHQRDIAPPGGNTQQHRGVKVAFEVDQAQAQAPGEQEGEGCHHGVGQGVEHGIGSDRCLGREKVDDYVTADPVGIGQ
jgi:hypothetical protein